jgi:hypothetical protein
VDRSLDGPVRAFVDEVGSALGDVAQRPAAQLQRDVAAEAFNLVAAFIDADGQHGDEELWAFISALAPYFETQLVRARPADIRTAHLVEGKRAWLDQPSALFDILVTADRRNGTHLARRYYDLALQIAFAVAAIDAHPGREELAAIEAFRGRLLATIDAASVARPETVAPAAKQAVQEPPQEPPRPLEELLAELDALVGLAGVKAEVKLVANLIQVQNLRRSRNLPVPETSRHLVFTGNPGTGKTTVARLLAQIYRTLGVVEKGHLVETDRPGLVAGFVGQTALKVTEVFERALGGVLLVDEAYALARGDERDFGQEAIDTLVKLVEDHRDEIVVIAAGYPEEMGEFVDSNPGLRSRFPRTIHFLDYTNDELVAIFRSLGDQNHYRCDDPALAKVLRWFESQPRAKGFGNGRMARNLFEDAVARQASRIVTLASPTDEQLMTLVADDIPDPGAS